MGVKVSVFDRGLASLGRQLAWLVWLAFMAACVPSLAQIGFEATNLSDLHIAAGSSGGQVVLERRAQKVKPPQMYQVVLDRKSVV